MLFEKNSEFLANHPLCNPKCRACHYKKLDYPDQLLQKQKWAENQLGQWMSVLKEIRPAPEGERLGYRSKSWLRCAFENGRISFGTYRSVYRNEGSSGGKWIKEWISWDTCPIHALSVQEMIHRLQTILPQGLSEFAERSLIGVWFGRPHLVLITRDSGYPSQKFDWSQLVVPPFEAVWLHCNPDAGRRIFGHRPIECLKGVSATEEGKLGGRTVCGSDRSLGKGGRHGSYGSRGRGDVPVRAFRQSAQTLLGESRRLAVSLMLERHSHWILDLYCGTGELLDLLPKSVGWIGVELSMDAIEYIRSEYGGGAQTGRILGAFAGKVEHRLADPKIISKVAGSYSVYINPPRSGLSEEARARLFELMEKCAPQCIAYLSCSASSLARDLKEFEQRGYHVLLLQPYDFFPQTEHFETLALLEMRRPKCSRIADSICECISR